MPHYLSPYATQVSELASAFYALLDKAYEEAPENEILTGYFDAFKDEKDAEHKLAWLFGHTYLTEPSMYPYIARVTSSDRFIMPTGPLALFLYEWIDRLSGKPCWKKIKGLYLEEPELPQQLIETNQTIYRNFTEGTGGKCIVYLNGYEELKSFLVNVLKWQDDESHTLPQMKAHRNFILMSNPKKGILLAKDICEYIADKENPMYDREKAQANAFRLLTEETLCPMLLSQKKRIMLLCKRTWISLPAMPCFIIIEGIEFRIRLFFDSVYAALMWGYPWLKRVFGK